MTAPTSRDIEPTRASATLERIRAFLLWILAVGLIGTFAELILLEHYEDTWQLAPLILIALGVIVVGWLVAKPVPPALRVFQATMWLFVASGLVGVFLHYKGNVEFELEMYPSLGGFGLFKEAIMGATPALAPGTMLQFGLLGLAYTFRHPALRGSIPGRSSTTRHAP